MINLPKDRLPAVLQGKLKFGNQAQISALEQLGAQIAAQEDHAKRQATGKLVYYEVNMKISANFTEHVWAKNECEACQIAEDLFCGDIDDWEIDYSEADEDTPRMECHCYTNMSDSKGKPFNWDQCPKHGNTQFGKKTPVENIIVDT